MNATVNQPFSYGVSVQNGATSYTATGVPPGLTFNTSTGKYSGTPTSTGTFSVAETATNVAGTDSATQVFVFSPPPPAITSSFTLTGTALSSFSYTIRAANSPTSFNAINLPLGLSLNSTTGVISGTPLLSGTFSFYVTATNQYGTASDPFSLTVNIPVPTAPTDLAATAWDGQVDLIWDAPYDATGYNVLRATSAARTLQRHRVECDDQLLQRQDRGRWFHVLLRGKRLQQQREPDRLRVRSWRRRSALGINAWQYGDIGAVGLAGSPSYASGTYTVAGSGSDIWGTADAFQFNCQEMTGDGAIVARVVSVQNTSARQRRAS